MRPQGCDRFTRREFLLAAAATGVALPALGMPDLNPHGRTVFSLNGDWKIYFDGAGRWKKSDWINDFLSSKPRQVSIDWNSMRSIMEPSATEIRVPATWEEYKPNTTGEAWYWREISLPEVENNRITRLKFNAVRYGAEVYLDGRRVGIYLGGFTPFAVDVSSLVKPGSRHQLAVHVINPGGGEAGGNRCIPKTHKFPSHITSVASGRMST